MKQKWRQIFESPKIENYQNEGYTYFKAHLTLEIGRFVHQVQPVPYLKLKEHPQNYIGKNDNRSPHGEL